MRSFAENAGFIKWLQVDVPGYIPPVRRGIEAATSELIAFLDDDAAPLEGWTSAIHRRMAQSDVGCVGGPALEPPIKRRMHDDAGQLRWYGRYIGNISAVTEGTRDVAAVRECNWAWRTELLRSLEMHPAFAFDDAALYGLDLCLQAKEKGYRTVHDVAMRVTHEPGERDPSLDRGDLAARAFTFSRNHTYIVMRHSSWLTRIAFMAWALVIGERGAIGLVRFAIEAIRRPATAFRIARGTIRGRFAGIRLWRTALSGGGGH